MAPYTVLFDLDGTLIDSIELIQRSKTYAFESRGLAAPSDAEWLAFIGTPLRAMFGHYTDDPGEVDRFIAAYREYQLEHHDRLVRAYEGAGPALAAIRDRGHPVGIVTSKSVELSERGLAHVGLLGYVDTIVGFDSLERHKPDPAPVHLALERLGAPAGRAMFVGDSLHDMHAGREAGVATVAALWGPFAEAELAPARPTYYLRTLAELPDLVARLDAHPADPETSPAAGA
ncbi:MAG: HAD-IA family hydrolase [Gemmatimonadota bacterium]|nr:HAD-IA family hydrolase [Gemmatimonadota bacterium]